VASANNLHADLLISVHHDSVPDNLKEAWQYEGKKNYYSDHFGGYATFVSNDNADHAGSLEFGNSLGQELQKRGLHYTPHYALPLMGDTASRSPKHWPSSVRSRAQRRRQLECGPPGA
jgi:hypothetical protein